MQSEYIPSEGSKRYQSEATWTALDESTKSSEGQAGANCERILFVDSDMCGSVLGRNIRLALFELGVDIIAIISSNR